jgi:hypothetical protein
VKLRTAALLVLSPSAFADKYGLDEIDRGEGGSGLSFFVSFLGVVCGFAAWRRYSQELRASPMTLVLAALAVGLFVLGAAIK